jgi:hypothetical protein
MKNLKIFVGGGGGLSWKKDCKLLLVVGKRVQHAHGAELTVKIMFHLHQRACAFSQNAYYLQQ